MNRKVPLVVTTAVVVLALAGCSAGGSSDADSEDGPVTLEYWAWGTAQKPLVDAWNASNPDIQVNHTDAGGGSDSSAKLVTAARADNAPDVALVEYNTLPAMIVAGVASDITEHIGDLEEQFSPGVWGQATFDGASYGVPQDAGPQALTYNKARFDELGIAVPKTWAEFADAAAAVRAADPDSYITTFAPAEFGGFAGLAQQAGAEWWTVDGDTWTVGFDDDASVAVAEYWQDLIDRDLVRAEPLLTPEWNAQLNDGKILSWPAGLWAAGVINGVAGDMAGQWAMAPLPQWTEGDPAVAFQGGSAVVVTSSSKHPEAAAKFASWMASEEASAIQIQEGQYPASLVGQRLTLESEPPSLMSGQTDYWEIAAQIAAETIPEITWGPNVNVASSAFQDAMSAAATNGTPLRDALTETEEVVLRDMETSGFTVEAR
ncbi:extracellular solute-binding protein [Microbacterium sp. zg-Y818]|uniref:ABC transporter substrate-binding protein n=1 Tax=unclassified Microbacterium TaxID=2609290 RepID=UPI00214B1140|nr:MULTISPECIES: extracellular solute-binding protein [unclassified Microbacterium]MCR2799498.1 extracellular solute-binding protein [Microbacterium sp. zg.Y818]WIM23926.1 extracellular solute-binding protein [Microbacterium sp. zg-Y818]